MDLSTGFSWYDHETSTCKSANHLRQVWPMGFGKGAEGTNGNGFQLLMIVFVELFGITLGQFIAAISPSVQVRTFLNREQITGN